MSTPRHRHRGVYTTMPWCRHHGIVVCLHHDAVHAMPLIWVLIVSGLVMLIKTCCSYISLSVWWLDCWWRLLSSLLTRCRCAVMMTLVTLEYISCYWTVANSYHVYYFIVWPLQLMWDVPVGLYTLECHCLMGFIFCSVIGRETSVWACYCSCRHVLTVSLQRDELMNS